MYAARDGCLSTVPFHDLRPDCGVLVTLYVGGREAIRSIGPLHMIFASILESSKSKCVLDIAADIDWSRVNRKIHFIP